MSEKEVSEALFNLRQEVERLSPSLPEDKERLEALLDDLEDRLEASEDPNQLHLVEDVKALIERFEADHPHITGILNQLMVALGSMGI